MENPKKGKSDPKANKKSSPKPKPKLSGEAEKKSKKDVNKKKQSKDKSKLDFTTEEDIELGIPSVPESPKKKNKLTVNSPGLSADLLKQMKKGGRMVFPVGRFFQELQLIEKDLSGKVKNSSILPVRFVPMTGKAQKRP